MNKKQIASIALRNILRRKKNTIGTVVTIMATVTLLIIMIGMQLGSHGALKAIYTGLWQGDYQLHPEVYTGLDDSDHFNSVIKQYTAIIGNLEKDKRLYATPRAQQFVLVSANEKTYAMQMVGIVAETEQHISMPLKTIKQGTNTLASGKRQIIIGQELASFLGINIGNALDTLGMDMYDSMVVEQFHVVGIFQTGEKNTDKMIALVSLDDFQDIFFDDEKVAHTIVSKAVKSSDGDAIQGTAERVAKKYNLALWAYSDLDPSIKDMFIFQTTITSIYYGCFILLIVLTLLNSFSMMTMNRVNEFGLLFALGVKPEEFKWILLWEIFFLNTIGIALGLIAGYLWLYHLSAAGFSLPSALIKNAPIMFPKTIYPDLTNTGILIGPVIIYCSNFFIIVPPVRKLKKMNIIRAITST